MSHFAKEALTGDPDGLVRLHRILHGRKVEEPVTESPAPIPTLAERFGHSPDPQPKQTRRRDAVMGEPRT